MELGLRGRSALITGASKGIGRAAAALLVTEGVNVTLVARTAADLEAASAELGGGHAEVRTITADLALEADRMRVANEANGVDILVNNAGGIPGGALTEFDHDTWLQAWQLKVFGYISMCRILYPYMASRGSGVMINVIGNAGEALDFDYICGSTANAALGAFTRTLGGGSVRDGVRVVGINPGPVETTRLETLMRKKAFTRTGSADGWEALKDPLPFGRAATAEEIAAMIAMLASDLSGYTSGTIVTIDGGIASVGHTF